MSDTEGKPQYDLYNDSVTELYSDASTYTP